MEELDKIYRNIGTPGALGGLNVLYKAAKKAGLQLDYKDIQTFLNSQDSYTLHVPVVNKFLHSKVYSRGPMEIFQTDVAFFLDFKKENDQFECVLIVVDIFSKMAYFEAMKSKSCDSILAALKTIFARSGFPKKLHSDEGKEYMCKKVQSYLKSQNIHHYITYSGKKAMIAERQIRTLKSYIYKYFDVVNSHRYIDVLPQLEHQLQNTEHRSIKMCPSQVNESNTNLVWQNLYGIPVINRKPSSLKIDDTVRVSLTRLQFHKSYLRGYSEELFKIYKITDGVPRQFYLKDLDNSPIKGMFYRNELVKVEKKDSLFKIDKILKKRKRKNKKEFLVSYLGYNSTFNQWIPASDVVKI